MASNQIFKKHDYNTALARLLEEAMKARGNISDWDSLRKFYNSVEALDIMLSPKMTDDTKHEIVDVCKDKGKKLEQYDAICNIFIRMMEKKELFPAYGSKGFG